MELPVNPPGPAHFIHHLHCLTGYISKFRRSNYTQEGLKFHNCRWPPWGGGGGGPFYFFNWGPPGGGGGGKYFLPFQIGAIAQKFTAYSLCESHAIIDDSARFGVRY